MPRYRARSSAPEHCQVSPTNKKQQRQKGSSKRPVDAKDKEKNEEAIKKIPCS